MLPPPLPRTERDMDWFRRKPKPKAEYRTYGCFYNERRQRWELCAPDAEITKLYLVQVWGPHAERQVNILDDYDSFQRILRHKVEMAQ